MMLTPDPTQKGGSAPTCQGRPGVVLPGTPGGLAAHVVPDPREKPPVGARCATAPGAESDTAPPSSFPSRCQRQLSLTTAPLNDTLHRVLGALRSLRLHLAANEHAIHRAVAAAFDQARLLYAHERDLGPRNRVDFLVAPGIAVEVKKGKPNSTQVAAQLHRYAASPLVQAVVLVVEGNVQEYPPEAHGKPVHYVSLHKNWGLSL